MWVGGEPYEYNAEKFLITSLDLPASSEVLQATASRPCVGVSYKLDQRVLMELIAQGCLPPVKNRDAGTGVGIGTMTDVLLEPFCRLLSLLDEPEAIPVLGPLIQREIHYRLLMSDQSDHLRQIAAVDGHGYFRPGDFNSGADDFCRRFDSAGNITRQPFDVGYLPAKPGLRDGIWLLSESQ